MSILAKAAYFGQVVLAVMSRIMCFVLFALAHFHNTRNNSFDFVFLIIGIHICIIMDVVTSLTSNKTEKLTWYKRIPQVMRNGLLDGLANMYLPFGMEGNASMSKCLFIHAVIAIENMIMTICSVIMTDENSYLDSAILLNESSRIFF